MMLHIYIPQPMSLPSINFLHFTFSEIEPRQDLTVKVTTARSKVKLEYCFARERTVFAEQKQSVPISNSDLAKITVKNFFLQMDRRVSV